MLKFLDGRTLFLAGALVAGVFTPMMWTAMRARKTYPGYGHWAASELLFALVFFLNAARGLVNDFYPVVLGNFFACGALLLLIEGVFIFCGWRLRRLWIYCISVLSLCGVYSFYFAHDDMRTRTMIFSAYLMLMTTYAALPLLHRPPPYCKFGYFFAAAVLLYAAFVETIRLASAADAPRSVAFNATSPLYPFFSLSNLMFIIGMTFSFFVLTNERAVAGLTDSNLALEHEVGERHRAEDILRLEVTERAKLEQKLQEMVVTDELTGVLNRRGLLNALRVEAERAARLGHPLAVLVMDLDHFKAVNDRYGHACGDDVLVVFAETCRKILRKIDTIGRVGGEEFAVLLPETGREASLVVAEKLRVAVGSAEVCSGEATLTITTSIGIAAWVEGDASGSAALAETDRALYAAKEAGRNCVRLAPEAQATI